MTSHKNNPKDNREKKLIAMIPTKDQSKEQIVEEMKRVLRGKGMLQEEYHSILPTPPTWTEESKKGWEKYVRERDNLALKEKDIDAWADWKVEQKLKEHKEEWIELVLGSLGTGSIFMFVSGLLAREPYYIWLSIIVFISFIIFGKIYYKK